MVHPLVEKFQNVKIKNSSLLPPEDVDYCKKQQAGLEATLLHLDESKKQLQELYDAEANPFYKLEQRYSDNFYVSKGTKYSVRQDPNVDLYQQYRYSPAYALVKIPDLRLSAELHFVHEIIEYFEKKYQVKVEQPFGRDREEHSAEWHRYERVIDHIRESLGGTLDFKAVARIKAINDFRNRIYKHENVEIKSRIINLSGFAYYSSYGTPTFNEPQKYIAPLDAAISLFEVGEVRPFFALAEWRYRANIDFSDATWPCVNGTRVESLRFFKNNKVAITFTDAQAAKDFYNLFDLGSIKPN